jgi:hypothetical protein
MESAMSSQSQSGMLIPADAYTSGLLLTLNRIYPPSDDAIWENRELQRRMRQDPDVNNALEKRVRTVSALDWEVEPEDPADPAQQAEAAAIERSIARIPRLPQLLKNLARGVWYGDAAAQFVYRKPDKPIVGMSEDGSIEVAVTEAAPVQQQPIHSDSVYFDRDGQMCVLVRPAGSQRMNTDTGLTPGPLGLYLPIDDIDRQRVCHVAFNIEAPDYWVARDVGQIFKGRGLRDLLWYSWWLKQSFYSGASRYCERFAHGRLVGLHPMGNDDAKREMASALKNYMEDNILLIPVEPDDTSGVRKHIDLIEASGDGYHLFIDMIDRLESQIQKAIIGASLTMDAEATGMGSSVADRHYQTFHDIVREDAATLSEAMTTDLVQPIQRLNFPDSGYHHTFKLMVPEDTDEFLSQVERFVSLGGDVPDDFVRQRIGIPKPEEGDDVLGRADSLDLGGSLADFIGG